MTRDDDVTWQIRDAWKDVCDDPWTAATELNARMVTKAIEAAGLRLVPAAAVVVDPEGPLDVDGVDEAEIALCQHADDDPIDAVSEVIRAYLRALAAKPQEAPDGE